MLLAFVKTADMLTEITLEVKPSRTSIFGTEIGEPRFLVNEDVFVELRLAPERLVTGRALYGLHLRHGLDVGMLDGLVLLQVRPLVQGQVTFVTHISLVHPHVPLEKEWILELLTAL